MRIGLFVPCYIDALFPEVGIATLELLERLGHEVIYPHDQTCCGQPMANSGFNEECAATEALYVRNFTGFDYVVAPSGSCVHHVRNNFDAIEQTTEVRAVRERTFEIVEFLHDILKVDAFPWARFPHRVGLHNSCGTLRRLGHANPSELHEPFFSKPLDLLSKVEGIQFVTPARPDECCGFGGTFSVFEEVVSTKMGYDKVSDHAHAGAEYIVSADTSCLMHQKGCAERIGVPVKFIHIAQILNGASS
jgi:L-lactate dehydrogenase complex protein LldE